MLLVKSQTFRGFRKILISAVVTGRRCLPGTQHFFSKLPPKTQPRRGQLLRAYGKVRPSRDSTMYPTGSLLHLPVPRPIKDTGWFSVLEEVILCEYICIIRKDTQAKACVSFHISVKIIKICSKVRKVLVEKGEILCYYFQRF